MKEAALKTDMGAMAPLVIGGILLWALVLRPNSKKAGKTGKAPPPTNGAAPAVEISALEFEGSPAESYITKRRGETFTAYITLRNTTTKAWRYQMELRFGVKALLGIAWTTDATMPVLRAYADVAPGVTDMFGLAGYTVPMDANIKTYDARIEVLVAGQPIPGGLLDRGDVFTVLGAEVPAEGSILTLAWV